MINTWFKLFFRNSKKNWLNLTVNVLGLALGLAVLILVTLYINHEESYNSWLPEKDNIYRVIHELPTGDVWNVSSGLEGPIYEERIPAVKEHTYIRGRYDADVAIYKGKRVFIKKITVAQDDFFDYFPFPFVKGTPASYKENQNNIALCEDIAEKIFGNEDPIGKTIKIDDLILNVAGVYQNKSNTYTNPEALIHFPDRMIRNTWGNYNYELFVKMDEQVDVKEIEALMDQIYVDTRHTQNAKDAGISLEEFETKHGFIKTKLEKLADIRLHHHTAEVGPEGKGDFQVLMILLGLSILLILISCVNFINLSTASAGQRAKEVGVKKTLGLSKWGISIRYMSEIIIQCLLALILAIIIVEVSLPYFNDFLGKELSLYNNNVLLLTGIITLVVSLLIGILPALYLANFKSVEVLKGNFSRSKSGVLSRNFMLGIQFFVSGFFLIGVLIVYSQVKFMMQKDAGFNGEQIIVFSINDRVDKYKKYELAKQELMKHPNILEVSSSMFIPGGIFVNGTGLTYKDERNITVATNLADFNYVDFAEIEIKMGRNLDPNITKDTVTSILINEAVIKALNITGDPIGQKLKMGWNDNKEMEIVGVMDDYHIGSYDEEVYPMLITNWQTFDFTTNWIDNIQVKIKLDDIPETLAFIEDYRDQNIEQGYPFDYEFVDKKFAKGYEKYQQQQTMFLILSIVVIIISLLGLFALATLMMQQRLREVAVRKVLGASTKDIVLHLSKSFIVITIIALIGLLPISYYFMQNWLSNFAYRIDMPFWPYLFGPIALIILVFGVVSIIALSAAKVDLIKYLKFE